MMNIPGLTKDHVASHLQVGFYMHLKLSAYLKYSCQACFQSKIVINVVFLCMAINIISIICAWQKYRFDLKKSNEVAVQQNEMQLPNSIQSTEPIDWFNPEGWTSQPDESILESVSVQSQNQQQGGGSLHVLPPPLDGFRIQTDWCNMNF